MARVHVWEIHWTSGLSFFHAAWEILSPAEQIKARAFRFDPDRQRYVLSHAALRRILSTSLSLPPRDIPIQQNRLEKPSVPGVEFNLSHSGDFALVAVSEAAPVGIDIEKIRTDLNLTELATRLFSPAERTTDFFRIWTRKEAYLKARGAGLSVPLSEFDVSSVTDWHVKNIPAPEGYAAALAVADLDPEIVRKNFGW